MTFTNRKNQIVTQRQAFATLIFCLLFTTPLQAASGEAATQLAPYGSEIPWVPQCISAEERELLNARIFKNEKDLKARGLLADFEDKALPPLLDWPMRFADGDPNPPYGVSNFVDHNTNVQPPLPDPPNHHPPRTDYLRDYTGVDRTYDGHNGTDYILGPFPWNAMDAGEVEIIAAAAGVIIDKDDNDFTDRGCIDPATRNPGCGNFVAVRHSGGARTLYCHMKSGSVTPKPIGARVEAGDYLGLMGSSGNSTEPHLHFEPQDETGNPLDPYSGPGNADITTSLWSNQRPYRAPALRKLATHSAAPVFNACPQPAVTNYQEAFAPGDPIVFSAYFLDELGGDQTQFTVRRPNGTIEFTWPHQRIGTPHPNNPRSFYWWPYVLPANAEPGIWTFEANHEGSGHIDFFEVTTAPDLAATDLSVDDVSMQHGQTVFITVTAENLGATASPGATIDLFSSTQANPIASFPVGSIAPGLDSGFFFSWTAPPISGNFLLGACVNPAPGDADFTNNCAPGVEIFIYSPLVCTGEPLIIHDSPLPGVDATLSEIDLSTEPFDFVDLDTAPGFELNNLAFNPADGLLYATWITDQPDGTIGIVMVDSLPTLLWLGAPEGLPTDVRLSAGDVSSDGQMMFLTAPNQPLYVVDLTWQPLTAAAVDVTGALGTVHDWAFNPADGKLYGGDQSHGQLAVITTPYSSEFQDADDWVRVDHAVTGLPAGDAYGGAWFDAAGNLNLFRNDGSVYTIDPTVPEIVEVRTGGPGASRNDVAACSQTLIGAAKRMTATRNGLPATVTIDYRFENFSSTESLFDVVAKENLQQLFGLPGVDWTLLSIQSTPSTFANGGFDGHWNTQLIDPAKTLLPGETAEVRVEIEVYNSGDGRFCNTVTVLGDTFDGRSFGDRSTNGLDPDPNSDSVPSEGEASCVDVGIEEFVCSGSGEVFIVQDEGGVAQLYRCATSLPLSCSPISALTLGGQPIEVNNLGFRASENMLYGIQLTSTGNEQLVKIDDNGRVFGLGRPSGLPANQRFDAGDLSPDGETLYLSRSGLGPLYTVDLTTLPLTATEVTITGHNGTVSDWAVHPTTGRLYGGDLDGLGGEGQLAIIDPGSPGSTTASRSDVVLPGLPIGKAFGGAWFDDSGHLILYRNDGRVFEVDIDIPAIIQEVDESEAAHFDGASCKP